MATAERLDVAYTNCFRNHPEGHALYKKISAKRMKPGACGYFDGNGDWQLLFQLTDQQDLQKAGLSALEGVEVVEEHGVTWNVKHSEGVTGFDIGGSVGASVTSTPVQATVTTKFVCTSGVGAVLMPQAPIIRHQSGPVHLFLNWMVKNAANVITSCPEALKKNDIWIATTTYTTKKCAIALLSSSSAEVEFSINLQAAYIGTITPAMGWWSRHKDSSSAIHEDDDGVVVFMSGISFRPKILRKMELKPELRQAKQRMYRGGNNASSNADSAIQAGRINEDEILQLLPEFVGDLDLGWILTTSDFSDESDVESDSEHL